MPMSDSQDERSEREVRAEALRQAKLEVRLCNCQVHWLVRLACVQG
jgi:hypothetical protein